MTNLFVTGNGLYHLLPQYLMVAPLAKGLRVLDLHCQTGEGTALLADGYASQLLGLDPSAHNIELASRRHGGANCLFKSISPNVDDLQSHCRVFKPDLILALNASEFHLREDCLASMKEAIGPYGLLCISTANPYRPWLPVGEPEGFLRDGPSIIETMQILESKFEEVRVYGQRPILGFVFGQERMATGTARRPVQEATLLHGEPEEPYGFLMLCGSRQALLQSGEEMLVQVGFSDFTNTLRAALEEREKSAWQLLNEEASVNEYGDRIRILEGQLEQARQAELSGGDKMVEGDDGDEEESSAQEKEDHHPSFCPTQDPSRMVTPSVVVDIPQSQSALAIPHRQKAIRSAVEQKEIPAENAPPSTLQKGFSILKDLDQARQENKSLSKKLQRMEIRSARASAEAERIRQSLLKQIDEKQETLESLEAEKRQQAELFEEDKQRLTKRVEELDSFTRASLSRIAALESWLQKATKALGQTRDRLLEDNQ